ncbi:MAG TPA: transporter [Sphingomonas sp.]|nr:transporter [Sphingomonas sp.]
MTLAVAGLAASFPAIAHARPTASTPRTDTTVEVVTGAETQQGDYGLNADVDVLSLPTTLRITHGKLSFAASLAYVHLTAPANVVTGGGLLGLPIIVPPTTSTERRSRSGIGDLRLAAGYTVSTLPVGLTLSAQAKLPTASAARGIGTGKADFALGGELFKQIGAVTPYLDIAYTMPGQPDGYRLNDSLSGQLGAAVQLGRRVRGHVAYAYAQAISPALGDQQAMTGGINVGLSRTLTLGMYGSAGLSRGAPDMVAGLSLGVRID